MCTDQLSTLKKEGWSLKVDFFFVCYGRSVVLLWCQFALEIVHGRPPWWPLKAGNFAKLVARGYKLEVYVNFLIDGKPGWNFVNKCEEMDVDTRNNKYLSMLVWNP